MPLEDKEALPDWFGISEVREEYIRDNVGKVFFCALENEKRWALCILNQQEKIRLNLRLWVC